MSGSINLTQSLVQKLGSSIVRGELPAGKSLPIEAELGKKFGASRTVMREAVKILSTKGLIGQRPRVGTYVHPEDKWDLLDAEVLTWILDRHFSHALVREFLEVRLGIEPAAAALAAVNATAATRNCCKQKLEKMKGAMNGHFDPVAADIAFHATILEISHNRFFHQLTPIVETALRFLDSPDQQDQGRARGLRRARQDLSRDQQRQCRCGDARLPRADQRSARAGDQELQVALKTDPVFAPIHNNIDIGAASSRRASSGY